MQKGCFSGWNGGVDWPWDGKKQEGILGLLFNAEGISTALAIQRRRQITAEGISTALAIQRLRI